MRLIYLLTYLALFPVVSYAQDRIGYTYDAAGNRIKREIVMSASKVMAKHQIVNSEDRIYSDMIREYSIKIYPNPTDGILRISISELKDFDRCVFGVYATNGFQIVTGDVATDTFDIDISNNPAGVYILRITINNNPTTWKIIKK